MEFKQCIVVREDLRLSSGKLAVQVAHASVLSLERADRSMISEWKAEGQRKIVLTVPSLQDLLNLKDYADRSRLPNSIVIDAGLTEIPAGTITALGIGPGPAKQIDKITGNLKLL